MTGIDRSVDVGSRLFLWLPEKHTNIVRKCLSSRFASQNVVDGCPNKNTVTLIVGLAIFEIHIDIF